MRSTIPGRPLTVCLALLFAVTVPLVAVAADPKDKTSDPLRFVPDQADVLIQVHQPRKLLESATQFDLYKQLQALPQAQEYLESTLYRRFLQLLAYYEKELGAPYPELLDKLAGGGIVVATKFAPNPAPAVVVMQGRDAKLTQKFIDLALQVIEQEMARQESKEKIEKDVYQKIEVAHIGKAFYLAIVGEALLFSNNEQAMKMALDLNSTDGDKSMAHVANVAAARKLLPPDPLATLWVNMEPAHKAPGADEVFKLPRKEFGILLTVFFGGNMDVARRDPYACAGLYLEKDGYSVTTRFPAGRDGSDPGIAVHIPPAGQIGSRPLLEPKNVLFSTSFYLDLAKFWEDRAKLYNDVHLKAFEDFDKNSGAVLTGTRFSQLLTSAGQYHRFVAVHQEKSGYTIAPKTTYPAAAVVVEQRDPEVFGRSMESILRAAALLGSTQLGLKLQDEMHGDVRMTAYRFNEKFPFKADAQDIRFNFSPCFFSVGKQWVIASTIELGHEMCDLLLKEDKGETTKGDAATVRTAIYSQGGAELLESLQDVLVTQAILDQAVPVDVAKEQVKAFIGVVRKLGTLELNSGYEANTSHYDVRLKLGK